MKLNRFAIYGFSLCLFLLGALALAHPHSVAAVSGSDWRANRIIDDSVFFNPNKASSQDIQTFLNSKVPTCDTNGTQPSEYGGGTRAQYGTSRGYPPPYTCLKDYSQSFPAIAADAYCGPISAATMSAASIIKTISMACSVNPHVLIVLLQKEQTLVTDDWPFSIQYNAATGYGCPDTASCDQSFAGFFNQVYYAARQYQKYAKNPQLFNYAAGRNSFVGYNPNSGCNGTNITMSNQATAGLYNYTPYQPNQAALNNLYGTGDSCSAYGNRNFWRLFNDWFGLIYGQYTSTVTNQYAYSDQTKSSPVDLTNLLGGQRVYVGFQVRNTGDVTWTNSGLNPVHAGTSNPQDRNSAFCDASWLGCNRPANMVEASVPPGGIATFEFWYKAPTQIGTYDEHFNLVSEGMTWMQDAGLYFHTIVRPPSYTWSPQSQYAYTNSSKTTAADLTNLAPGQSAFIGFTAKNTGNVAWSNTGSNPVDVGSSNPLDRSSPFCDTSDSPAWLGCNRPAKMVEPSVAPGQTATFEFWYKAPPQSGVYREYFRPVAEGIAWMNDPGLNFYTVVHFDTSGTNTLDTNQTLSSGQSTTSTDGRYRLILQGDGNLVLYSVSRALWSSNTAGRPVTRAVMQGDGNLVIYNAQNVPYWSSGTAGRGTSRLIMQGDGNLVIYNSGGIAIWATHTNGQF